MKSRQSVAETRYILAVEAWRNVKAMDTLTPGIVQLIDDAERELDDARESLAGKSKREREPETRTGAKPRAYPATSSNPLPIKAMDSWQAARIGWIPVQRFTLTDGSGAVTDALIPMKRVTRERLRLVRQAYRRDGYFSVEHTGIYGYVNVDGDFESKRQRKMRERGLHRSECPKHRVLLERHRRTGRYEYCGRCGAGWVWTPAKVARHGAGGANRDGRERRY